MIDPKVAFSQLRMRVLDDMYHLEVRYGLYPSAFFFQRYESCCKGASDEPMWRLLEEIETSSPQELLSSGLLIGKLGNSPLTDMRIALRANSDPRFVGRSRKRGVHSADN